jgi:hypothetical protein
MSYCFWRYGYDALRRQGIPAISIASFDSAMPRRRIRVQDHGRVICAHLLLQTMRLELTGRRVMPRCWCVGRDSSEAADNPVDGTLTSAFGMPTAHPSGTTLHSKANSQTPISRHAAAGYPATLAVLPQATSECRVRLAAFRQARWCLREHHA